MPNISKYDLLHAQNVNKYADKVRNYYLKAIKEISKLSNNINLNANSELYLKAQGNINEQINNVLKELQNNVYGTTVEGINSEWDLAVEKNNELAQKLYGKDLKDLPKEYREKYLSNNALAKENFLMRKNGAGLGLSDLVWNNTKQLKQELELALEVGIGKGQSAQSIAKDIKQYLNDPDKLFRRVRNKENGVLRLSKAAQSYHPGQGRYRSSYKNALRLTRNETNFSYEGSNHLKQQQQDFIVGIEIRTSPQHREADDKGGINCTALQGKYPKEFNFTYKWHVNCKCMSLNILKTKEELSKDVDLILSGKEPLKTSENLVSDLPNHYTSYLKDNEKKWNGYKNPPRTFENNKSLFRQAKNGGDYVFDENSLTNYLNNTFGSTLNRVPIFNIDKEHYQKVMGNFNVEQLIKDLHSDLAPFGGMDVTSFSLLQGSLSMDLKIFGMINGKDFNMSRTFYKDKSLIHNYFELHKDIQGGGISKVIFRDFYKQYQNGNFNKIEVGANIDVGGYTWGRYGFECELEQVSYLIKSRFQNNEILHNKYLDIFDNWIINNPTKDYFPMNLLCNKETQQYMLNSHWDGVLDLNDKVQREVFEDYLAK
jgi:hypothetical protein